MGEYNCYSVETLREYYEMGKNYSNEYELYSLGINSVDLFRMARLGMNNEVIDFAEKTFYRIGEPRKNAYENAYENSFNFADEKPEIGVSVITENWLNSLKAVFFGISNEKLQNKGVYKIKGIIIGYGGDDEPLIYPTDWAKKTKIRSVTGILKAIKETK